MTEEQASKLVHGYFPLAKVTFDDTTDVDGNLRREMRIESVISATMCIDGASDEQKASDILGLCEGMVRALIQNSGAAYLHADEQMEISDPLERARAALKTVKNYVDFLERRALVTQPATVS